MIKLTIEFDLKGEYSIEELAKRVRGALAGIANPEREDPGVTRFRVLGTADYLEPIWEVWVDNTLVFYRSQDEMMARRQFEVAKDQSETNAHPALAGMEVQLRKDGEPIETFTPNL